MAKLCPMDGCKKTEGMCIHDKIIVVVVVVVVLVIIAKVAGLF